MRSFEPDHEDDDLQAHQDPELQGEKAVDVVQVGIPMRAVEVRPDVYELCFERGLARAIFLKSFGVYSMETCRWAHQQGPSVRDATQTS